MYRVTSNPFATKLTPKRPNPVKAITPRNVASQLNLADSDRILSSKPSKVARYIASQGVTDSSLDITEFDTQEINKQEAAIDAMDVDAGNWLKQINMLMVV